VSAAPERLRVALGERSYDILVGPGLIDRAGEEIRARLQPSRVVVVTDSHLAATPFPDRLEASLAAAGLAARREVVPPGEASKSFSVLERLLDALIAGGADRRTLLVVLGGGVVGDLAGFAAAILLRGVDHVQLPTTLLAQVDSAIGGKTGINTARGKNLVGAFHQPRLVLIDPATLDTLPARELRAGYAEVVKYGLIDDPAFFAWLEREGGRVLARDADALARAIVTSLQAKARVVEGDERETSGRRALLNLGHTFAHAYEAESGYDGGLLHGEAVALGLVKAFELSRRLGLCPQEHVARVRDHLASHGLPVEPGRVRPKGFDPDRLLAAMARDKKVQDGRINFVLVRGIGRAFAGTPVAAKVLRPLLDHARA
jgi:3-dehydroquinate synthase